MVLTPGPGVPLWCDPDWPSCDCPLYSDVEPCPPAWPPDVDANVLAAAAAAAAAYTALKIQQNF